MDSSLEILAALRRIESRLGILVDALDAGEDGPVNLDLDGFPLSDGGRQKGDEL